MKDRKEMEKTEQDRAESEEDGFTYHLDSLNGAGEEDELNETQLQYARKKQGEYTVEDYYALPDEQRVELIDGVIYDMAAPGAAHQTAALQIAIQLDDYIRKEGGNCVPFISPIDVQLDRDDRTMVQPDVVVLCDKSKYTERCIYGVPDLVIEVLSPGTSFKDIREAPPRYARRQNAPSMNENASHLDVATVKFQKYQNAGVREYWIVNLEQQKVIVYDFEHSVGVQVITTIYGTDSPIPVQIYDGKCQITFEQYFARMKTLGI